MKPIHFDELPVLHADNINWSQVAANDLMLIYPNWGRTVMLHESGMSVARQLIGQGYHFLPPVSDCDRLLQVSLPEQNGETVIRGDLVGQLIVAEGVKNHGWVLQGMVQNEAVRPNANPDYVRHIYECHAPTGEKWGEPHPCYMAVVDTVFTPPVMLWFHENDWKLSEPKNVNLPTYYRSYRLGGMFDDPTFVIPAFKERKQTRTHQRMGWPELWTMLPDKPKRED